jgi:NAD+ kinase
VDKPLAIAPDSREWSLPTGHAPTLGRIGVLCHPKIDRSHVLAEEIATALGQLGAHVWVGSAWNENAVRAQIEHLDLLVTLGGDGSMLRAARMSAPFGVPILGINLGRLGFLAEIEPDQWPESLPRVLEGGYRIEECMMLRAESRRGDKLLGSHDALNDVVVSRGSLARVVRIHTHIDGYHLTHYVADGLIVSTATGSTAYALAVGGPILPPTLDNILLIPIAPHLSMERAIVLNQGATVDMRVVTDHQAILTVDGQFEFTLLDGDRVTVRASPHIARFVRLQSPAHFYRTLMARLRVANDEPPEQRTQDERRKADEK